MKTIDEVKKQLTTIKAMGYVKTHRVHDTGIGKTLEDLLGIPENNIKLPDIGDIELKAKRIDSGSMLTIATKSPLPAGVNKVLFETYKYIDTSGYYCLHSTVYGSRINNQGLKITLKGDNLVLENPQNITAYWPISIFDDTLKSKSNKILLVFAETKGERITVNEQFHYTEAYLLSNMNRNKFLSAIANDKLKVDIRIGVYRSGSSAGQYHDHGTGFRINKADFLQLFDSYESILSGSWF
jgi:hypothetical protein